MVRPQDPRSPLTRGDLIETRSWRWTCVLLVVLLFLAHQEVHIAEAQSVINTLPGYNGTLPFKLETGYISVGENEDVELFYYFIESEGNPRKDPLLLWFTGGPGCSSFSGLVFEIGPLAFDVAAFDGSFPTLLLNPYSWTKVASIIFIDSPVGAGFSYATTSEGYYTSDTKSAADSYTFIRKWLLNNPRFIKNQLFIGGDSYGGKLAPMVAWEISQGNEAGIQPHISLRGYVIGNPAGTDLDKDFNEAIPYANRMGLYSDEYYELAVSSCDGKYNNPDPNNVKCMLALQLFRECTGGINTPHILEPFCEDLTSRRRRGSLLQEDHSADRVQFKLKERRWCRWNNYIPSLVWANDPAVQEALYIRKGTITEWVRCNRSLSGYEQDVESAVHYHELLSKKLIQAYQALVYSGDHDMDVPYTGTLRWIKHLNLTPVDYWRHWSVDGQVAGYTESYKNNKFLLTFATVMGAGHTAPEYKPKECLAMVDRFFSYYPL